MSFRNSYRALKKDKFSDVQKSASVYWVHMRADSAWKNAGDCQANVEATNEGSKGEYYLAVCAVCCVCDGL